MTRRDTRLPDSLCRATKRVSWCLQLPRAYAYIYIYIGIHVYMHMYIQVYMICIHVCAYIYIYTSICVCVVRGRSQVATAIQKRTRVSKRLASPTSSELA